MSGGQTSGGGFFSGFIGRTARSMLENYALNSTTNSTTTGSVPPGRSFFDIGSDFMDGVTSQVIEYSGKKANDEIASIYPISVRSGDLILHGPRKDGDSPPSSSSYLLYNIILHSTNASKSSEKMFSLFRTDIETEASRVFVIYKQIFPDLVKASATSIDKATLEKIVKLSKRNESYEAAHIAAALGMVEQLKSQILRDKFCEQDGMQLHTPLHVACIHGKIDAVKSICEDERQLNRVYDYSDIKGNTIVHLAADCKDKAVGAAVVKLLKEKLLKQSSPNFESNNRAFLELFRKLNYQGQTCLHVAAKNENVEIVKHVMRMIEAVEFLEDVTSFRNEALVKELRVTSEVSNCPSTIDVASTYLDIKDSATGSTPLHFATPEPELLSELLAFGSDPNITDNDGLTSLHKAVLQNNLKSTIHLLSNNAYTNFKATFDTYNSATPLHIAASNCSMDCLKALIVFGADMEVQDGNGHTARHIIASVYKGSTSTREEAVFILAAAGAKRCGSGTGGCSEWCKLGGKRDGNKPPNWRINKDGTTGTSGSKGPPESLVMEAMRGLSIMRESLETSSQHPAGLGGDVGGPVVGGRLLALDGGGIRGLVLTQILFYMEKEFGNFAGGGAPIISYFDWVAGTSTGGILALALASGKSVLETQSLYMKLKDKLFTGDRPYSSSRMEEFLKKEFGPDKKMSSIQKPRVMIMTSLANRRPLDLYIFRNYMSPSSLLGEPEEYTQLPEDTYVWQTAKVTGAAPSYFTLEDDVFIDGGLISNNPTLDALAELAQFKAVMIGSQQSVRSNGNGWKLPSLVLSLGTGVPPRSECSATNLDIAWPKGVIDAIRNVPRLTDLVSLLVDQATQAEGQVAERARAWCTTIGVPYFRFSPGMGEDVDLDEKRDDILVHLMWETWCYMVGNRNTIREIYERLQDLDIGNTKRLRQGKSPEMMDTI